MRQFLASLTLPAMLGLLLTLPFMVMELINRRQFNDGFPVALFVLLWLLGTAFAYIGRPLIGDTRMSPALLLRLALMLIVAWLWISTVTDQMPCFLGVPNCD
jgi:hypothetical protein